MALYSTECFVLLTTRKKLCAKLGSVASLSVVIGPAISGHSHWARKMALWKPSSEAPKAVAILCWERTNSINSCQHLSTATKHIFQTASKVIILAKRAAKSRRSPTEREPQVFQKNDLRRRAMGSQMQHVMGNGRSKVSSSGQACHVSSAV